MSVSVRTKIDVTKKTFAFMHDLVTEATSDAISSAEFEQAHYNLMREVASNLNEFYLSRNSEKI